MKLKIKQAIIEVKTKIENNNNDSDVIKNIPVKSNETKSSVTSTKMNEQDKKIKKKPIK